MQAPPEFLYRFRSTRRLLDDGELERQEIYFASSKRLNDPVEGYLDVFWNGDEVVWRNFFKNYLVCLHWTRITGSLMSPGESLENAAIPVFMSLAELPTDIYREKMQKIFKRFFSTPEIELLVKHLGSNNKEIRRDELVTYLRLVHLHAMNCILSDDNPSLTPTEVPKFGDFGKLLKILGSSDSADSSSRIGSDNGRKLSDFLFEFTNHLLQDFELLATLKEPSASQPQLFIGTEFPQRYIEQLEQLIYPPWYVACFVRNTENASMWAHYADGHRGICLKFRSRTDVAGPNSQGLRLKTVIGIRGGRNEPVEKIFDWRVQPFLEVNYEKTYPAVDFFRSLGRLSMPRLLADWFTDEDGNQSKCWHEMFIDEDEWRRSYWERFHASYTTKLKDWAYESEYRLTLASSLVDLDDEQARKLCYDFKDLTGIIFGLNTPTSEKVAIMKIVDGKCFENETKNFKFYQAYYSHRDGKILHRELKGITRG